MLLTFVLLFCFSKSFVKSKTKIECGYKQCPQTREGALNVHIIPHSHMDAGWVKTFDEYYYGTRSGVSTANVQLIYHSVLSELLHDKRRKFTFSETAYFWRWWKEQRPGTRATFRSLVQEGRAQFAGAGWTHADSSTLNYLQALDHATWGLRKLNDTLGPCGKPKAAWQIDTYGHSREMTSLLAQMGFDGLFIGRVDHKDREAMMEEDRMEFMWRGSDVLGKMSDIMTHTLFNLYNAPDGFCFDFLCNDEPIVEDPDSKVYNADKRVNDFVAHIERQAKYYDHDNIMVTMGGDFTYQSAPNWFMNIDKLINHVNTHPANLSDFNIFYSTPACYLKAIYLYGRRDKAIYTEKGDLLPYGSDSSTYWTGFYTSRPSLKYFVKRSHIFLQVVKQLTVIARSVDSYELHLLRHAVGLLSHHDAVTGTSQQHVTNDFITTLSEAIDVCTKKVSNLISYLTPTWGGNRRAKGSQQFYLCHQLNMSQCRFVESQESLLLLVYNPLSVKNYHYVRLPAIAMHYSIRDFNDEEVEYQLVPLPAAITNLPGRTSNAIQELWFEAENIPPLGYTSFYLSPIRDQLEENNYAKKAVQKTLEADELIPHISNEYIKVTVDPTTGLLDTIQHLDGIKLKVSQNFYFYAQGHQPLQSGAYSFRPEKNRPTPVAEKAQYITIRGNLVKEIRQRFSDWITQIIRLFRGEELVEFQWIIGPVPIGTDLGKEVVTIFKANITNNGEFYTDSNGRQMMKRTCWNETSSQQQKKPVPACYYPVTSRICIKSTNTSTEMCVLTDRTQGGTSYEEGEIELMTHRRLLTDDGFGLEEPLNEEAYGVGLVVKGTHRIIFGDYRQDSDGMTFSERVSANSRRWDFEPWLFFTSGEKVNRRKWQNVRNKRFSALKVHGLPRHIHILTLEPWKGGSVLLRLENTLEKVPRAQTRRDSDGIEDTSSIITVELRNIFLQLHLKSARETTLGANQWLEDARQMDWSTRYVYNGGEDGIQPEDQPAEEENKSIRHTEEEEPEYPVRKVDRRKNKGRLRSKSTKYIYDRRKRSLNQSIPSDGITESDILNFNLIFNDPSPPIITKVMELKKRYKRTVNNTITNDTEATSNDYKGFTLNDTLDLGIDKFEVVTEKLKVERVRNKRKRYKNWSKNRQNVPALENIDEIRSSEEDFSLNLKKNNKRKNKRNSKKRKEVPEIVYDDSDDVTTSIYEMYYKTKSKQVTERPQNIRRRYRRRKLDGLGRGRKRHNTEGKRRAEKEFSEENQGYEFPTPQRRTLQRRHALLSEEDRDTDYDDDYDDEDSEEERKAARKKRLVKDEDNNVSEAEATNEPEFMVTLRPTQIRTFVVWFESGTKKGYSNQ